MSSVIRILPQYTYADYLHWEGKWELIDGIPHAMSPSPQPEHQRVTGNIFAEFRFALKKCKACKAYEPLDYKISDDTVLMPDMLVVCKPVKKAFLDFTPALIVETLSPSTASKDRLYKYNLYQQQGVLYYLIVDAEKKKIEVYELKDGKYELTQSGKDFQHQFDFPAGCGANIDFGEVWN